MSSNKAVRAFLLVVTGLLFAAHARAADLPGAKDPAFLKRFQGAEIVNYETQPFDKLFIASPDPKNAAGSWIATPVEGRVTRIVYHLPSAHSVLEVLRNYEQALKAAGLTQVDEKRDAGDVRDFGGLVYNQPWENAHDFMWSNLGLAGMQQYAYVTAKGTAGGAPVRVQVFIGTYSRPVDVTYTNPVHYTPDQPVVIVDVVAPAAAGIPMVAGPAPGDVAGGKDPAFLKRLQGATIIDYQTLAYDELKIASPDSKGAWIVTPYEGQITRTIYQGPKGHSTLEVLRAYEQALKAAGLAQADELLAGADMARDFAGPVYHQGWETNGDFRWTNLGLAGVQQMAYVTAVGAAGGHPVHVQVYIANYSSPIELTYANKVEFDPGQTVIVVDTVTAAEVVNQMVTVKAADMAATLAKKGVVDLYGIYFDVDKTDIKMESAATLNEIASLLKANPALRLEISGHTDNTGTKEHNMVLSQGRANAVMAALVGKYGIGAARLTAKGYGDTKPVVPNTSEANKAKNRRVELRKL